MFLRIKKTVKQLLLINLLNFILQKIQLKPPPGNKLKVDGVCDRQSKFGQLILSWDDAKFTFSFGLDELIDSWFVTEFSLEYDTSSPAFKGKAKGRIFSI